MKTLSFFGEGGLTSTSANHIANLCKEYIRAIKEKLSGIRLYNESISLIGSSNERTVSRGFTEAQVHSIPALLTIMADAHSLIAFLREGIKEKERLMKEAMVWTDKDKDEEFYHRSLEIRCPIKAEYPTEETIRKEWSVGQQEKYLSLEAEAAVLGKAIHEDCAFSNARLLLMHKIENPISVAENGVNTIIHTYTPSVSLEDVNTVYNSLQARHRAVQAELNGMKKIIDDTILERKLAIDNAYSAAMREYDAQNLQWERDKRIYEEERDLHRAELMKEVQALKIVVPNRLKDIYEKVQTI